MTNPWSGLVELGPSLRPAGQGGSVEVQVPCTVLGSDDPVLIWGAPTHTVTVHDDWRIEVPHDLPAERVAALLGHGLSCVELIDRVLPAVRRGVQVTGRRVQPASLASRARTGSDRPPWPLGPPSSPGTRAEATRRHVWVALVKDLSEVGTELFLDLLHAFEAEIDRGEPPADLLDSGLVAVERAGGYDACAQILWDQGFCREALEQAHRHLSPDGAPLPIGLLMALAERDHDLVALSALAHHGPAALTALVDAGAGSPGPDTLDRLDGLLRLGVRPHDLSALLSRGVAADAILAQSDRLALWPPAVAARLLLHWQELDCHPTWSQLESLAAVGVDPFDLPWDEEISAVSDLLDVDRTEAALMVALVTPAAPNPRGDLVAAVFLLGVRDFDGALARLYPARRIDPLQPILGDAS